MDYRTKNRPLNPNTARHMSKHEMDPKKQKEENKNTNNKKNIESSVGLISVGKIFTALREDKKESTLTVHRNQHKIFIEDPSMTEEIIE